MDHLHLPSHSRFPESTFPHHRTQFIPLSPIYTISLLPSTTNARPSLYLRVNNIHHLRSCSALQDPGKTMGSASIPRRASNPRLWSGGSTKNMAVGDSKWPLSQQSSEYVFCWDSRSSAYTLFFPVPKAIGMTVPPFNPALPPRKVAQIPSRFRPPGAAVGETIGHGPNRIYLDVQARPPDVAYPPRPVPGSVADLDIIMDMCDFPSKVLVSRLLLPLMRLIYCLVCP